MVETVSTETVMQTPRTYSLCLLHAWDLGNIVYMQADCK